MRFTYEMSLIHHLLSWRDKRRPATWVAIALVFPVVFLALGRCAENAKGRLPKEPALSLCRSAGACSLRRRNQ